MLLDRPIVSFDIETIPDPEIGRRAMGIEGSDEELVHEMVRQRREETEGRTEYPQPPWHRVVAICATVLDPKTGNVQVRALGEDPASERSVLRGFFQLVSRELVAPRLVSWNGSGFDLPIIQYRSMQYGISAPSFYRVDGDWKWNNYQNRYHDMHVDVMDVLSGYGASVRVGLATLGKLVQLPGKEFLDRPIYDHLFAGELDRILEYCKLDTVETLLAFLLWAHHRGEVSTTDLVRHVDATRRAIVELPYDGWRAVEAMLDAWPAWARNRCAAGASLPT